MDIREEVNSYKTKHKHGFTRDEYMKLLENYPGINMERFWDALWYYQRIDDETVVFHRGIELAIRCGMDAMYEQLKIEVNASETQKYYKSKEVQDLDNPTDVVDEYPKSSEINKTDFSVSLPSKDEVIAKGCNNAKGSEYNRRNVLKDVDDDLYYTGWMDCYDWLTGNDD